MNRANPDFQSYHKSLQAELEGIKNRIRNLVTHYPTDGAFKEAALRSVLRRHLPDTVFVGRGFIVTPDECSSEIDILIVDSSKPTLFRDGELLIVTPDAVRAIAEVKTSLKAPLDATFGKLAKVKALCVQGAVPLSSNSIAWAGLFVYDSSACKCGAALAAIRGAHTATNAVIDAVSIGGNCFIRFWDVLEGRGTGHSLNAEWRAYELQELASAYFVSNLVDAVTPVPRHLNQTWFPIPEGKVAHIKFRLRVGSKEIEVL